MVWARGQTGARATRCGRGDRNRLAGRRAGLPRRRRDGGAPGPAGNSGPRV